MVSELRLLCEALETIASAKILRTRWYAEKIDAPLPAVIADYSRPYEPLLLENGIDVPDGDYFYLEVAVKRDYTTDPLEALERLETLLEEVRQTLRNSFSNEKVLFLQPEIVEMPFGKQTSLSFICDLYIG